MTADFTRTLMPAPLRDAMLDQGRRGLAFQKELLSWQLAQLQRNEEQVTALWKLSLDNGRAALERGADLQARALDALSPAAPSQAG